MIVNIKVDADNSIAVLAGGVYSAAVRAAAEEIGDLIAEELSSVRFKGETSERDQRGGPRFAEGVVVDPSSLEGGVSVYSRAPYAYYLEVGSSGPYIISGHGGRLVFDGRANYISTRVNQRTGKRRKAAKKVAVSSVEHPGIQNPPRPYTQVMRTVTPQINAIVNKYVNRAFSTAQAARSLPSGITTGVFTAGTRKGQRFFRGAGGRFVSGSSL